VVEATDKIKQHIDSEREILGRILEEIEYRFKKATDVKGYFDRNTGWILGGAVAGGFLLSLALRRSSRSTGDNWQRRTEERTSTMPSRSPRLVIAPHLNRLSETVDNIVAGLVGVFSDNLRSFVAEAVPGFQEQYDKQHGDSPFRSAR